MRKVKTVEEYCIEKEKTELLQSFMKDIDTDISKNMCCPESILNHSHNDRIFLINFKCHNCNTEWEGSAYSYIVKELTCPTCNENSDPIKIRYASRKRGSITLDEWCDDHAEIGQRIRDEWTGIAEDGNQYTIEQVPYGSNIRMLWECSECKHKWFTVIWNRTRGDNCPECANKIGAEKRSKPTPENSLLTWCLQNPEQGQIIQNEWTGISEDGRHLTIDEVSYASNIKMLWRCKGGHEWVAMIWDRTNGHGCSQCNNRSTSYPEQFIYWSLKQLYPETQNRCVVLKSKDNPRGIEYDIVVPNIPLAIEYSPTYWHNNREEKDNYKKEICNKCNIRFIQIIEDNYNEYEKEFTENYICIPELKSSNRDDHLIKIAEHILSTIGHSLNEIDIELVKKNALKYSKNKIEYEKSLAYIHPELAKEMDNGMNNIKSDEITIGSTIRIKFLCPNCGYGSQGEWETTINSRAYYKSGCKQCGYNWDIAENNIPQKIKPGYRKIKSISKQIENITKVINYQPDYYVEEDMDF